MTHRPAPFATILLISATLSGCGLWSRSHPAAPAVSPQVTEQTTAVLGAKADLEQLRNAPELAVLVRQEIADADQALKLGLHPATDPALAEHQRYMAQKSVELAWARARERVMLARLEALAKSSGDKRFAVFNPQQTAEPLAPPPKLSTPSPESLKPAQSRTARSEAGVDKAGSADTAALVTSLKSLILPDRAFSPDGTRLSRDGGQALRGIVTALRSSPEKLVVAVHAYMAGAVNAASGTGSGTGSSAAASTASDIDSVQSLAHAKAETVHQTLLSLGVDEQRIRVDSQTTTSTVSHVEVKIEPVSAYP